MNSFSKKVMKMLAALSAMVLVLTACNTTTNAEKVLRVAIEKAMTTLDYQEMTSRAEMEQVSQIMEGLTRYDATQTLAASGAESWTISEDYLTYTFKIREGASWTNGEPVTANDYVFAWKNLVLNQKSNTAFFVGLLKNGNKIREGAANIDQLGVTAPDDYTLVVELEQPYASFLDCVSTVTYYPLNEKAYTEIGTETYGTSAETIVTNGAFELTNYEPASILELTKSETYWDAKNVKLSKVIVNIVPELTTQSVMFDSGELDIIRVTGDLTDIYTDEKNVVSDLEARIVYMYLSGDTATESELLSNRNFRQAIAHAIDKSIITENILKDGSLTLESLIPAGFGHVEGQSFRAYTGTYNEPIYDVIVAQDYLTKAKDELPTDTNYTIKLHVQTTGVYSKVFENIKSQIETNLAGVTVELEMIPNQIYFAEAMKKATPAGMGSWSAAYVDYHNFTELFEKGATFNYADYNNVSYDALVEKAVVEGDVEAQAKLYADAEKMLIEDAVFIPLYQVGAKYKTQDGVTGVILNQSAPSMDYKFIDIK